MPAPWDVYIDERKNKGDKAIGFLVVPNTPSFMRKLYLCRNIRGSFRPHEVHWSSLRGDSREVAEAWIYRTFQHNGAQFFLERWDHNRTKEYVVTRFLDHFAQKKRLDQPYNIVAFLDFDDDHSRADTQNAIQRTAGIARCYHLDSRNNDCIQCCDLLMNATIRLRNNPLIRSTFPDLESQIQSGERLSVKLTKDYLAGFLAKHLDKNGRCVYDNSCKIKLSTASPDNET